MNNKSKIEIWLAVSMCIFGCALITAGFIVNPAGRIDPTVLTAFGEILTFAGSVIGIDYSYRRKAKVKPDGDEPKEQNHD